jgi:hypothetical protein
MPRTLELAVRRSLRAAGLDPIDGAAAALALIYARRIDEDVAQAWHLGIGLMAVLVELRLTPRARGERPAPRPAMSELDAIRARRHGDAS